MSQILNNPNYEVYYIDTDGIILQVLSDDLLDKLIGNDLGMFKIEHRF